MISMSQDGICRHHLSYSGPPGPRRPPPFCLRTLARRRSARDVSGRSRCKCDVEVEAREEGRGDKHQHRTFRDLRAMLEASPLRPGVKQRALAIFSRLAEAEG